MRWLPWIVIATGSMLSSCTTGTSVQAGGCSNDNDCAEGFVCLDTDCALLCVRESDCQSTQTCSNGLCVEVPNPSCTSDAGCQTAESCLDSDGRCVAGECQFVPSPANLPCDDGNACTNNDACDGTGNCEGQNVPCGAPPHPECIDSDTVYRVYSTGVCEPSTGICSFPPVDNSCPSCAATCLGLCDGIDCQDLNGGCRSQGTCDVTQVPIDCTYVDEPDGNLCVLGASEPGVCSGGECVQCLAATDCTLPSGASSGCVTVDCVANECQFTVLESQECAAQACENGLVSFARVCDANGACPAAGTGSCGGFACDPGGVGCLGGCTTSDDCSAGFVCSVAGTCGLPLGSGCMEGAECASGHCADGVCCNEACDGTCMDCSPLGLCDVTPADDQVNCSAVDCIGESTTCRTYNSDITTQLCAGFGACKTVADCLDFTDAANGTTCRPADLPCDAEEGCLDGACPADQPLAAGVECRAASGTCDSVPELCNGVDFTCPTDNWTLVPGASCSLNMPDTIATVSRPSILPVTCSEWCQQFPDANCCGTIAGCFYVCFDICAASRAPPIAGGTGTAAGTCN